MNTERIMQYYNIVKYNKIIDYVILLKLKDNS